MLYTCLSKMQTVDPRTDGITRVRPEGSESTGPDSSASPPPMMDGGVSKGGRHLHVRQEAEEKKKCNPQSQHE